jgi:hypothetical protein
LPDTALAINSVFTPPPDAVGMLAQSWTPPAQAATTRLRSNGHVIEPAMLREAERVLAIAAELERAAVERGG